MKKFFTTLTLAFGVAATVTVGSFNPVMAAPLASSSAAVKEAAPESNVTEVHRWRGRHVAGALIGLGALALIYEGSRRHHRYHRGYYYGGHPGYYAYGGGYRDCFRRHGRLYCSGY